MNFLKEFNGENSNYLHNFYKIKLSCKAQSEKMKVIKIKVKNTTLNSKYYNSIKNSIPAFNDRLNYLLKFVIFEYFEMTPLSNYMRKLEAQNISLEEDIQNNIDFDESVKDNESVKNYVEKVLNSLDLSSDDYMERKIKYEKFLEVKKSIIETEKQQKKKEKQDELFDLATHKIEKEANDLKKSIFSLKASSAMPHLINSFVDLKKKGHKNAKIIVLGNVKAGKNAARQYIGKDGLTKALNRTIVFAECEPIPEYINEKVNNKEYAIAEIIIPL